MFKALVFMRVSNAWERQREREREREGGREGGREREGEGEREREGEGEGEGERESVYEGSVFRILGLVEVLGSVLCGGILGR